MSLTDVFDRKFTEAATQLAFQFPNLDLRFHRTEGEEFMRCMLPEFSDDILEFHLGAESESIVFDAIFAIKEMAQLFDA